MNTDTRLISGHQRWVCWAWCFAAGAFVGATGPCPLSPRPSAAKGGMISAIVPMISHMDHIEHSVQIIVTEQGVADLRGKDPHERAQLIINNCAHPAYREQLRDYLKLTSAGHAPLSLSLAMHRELNEAATRRGTSESAAFGVQNLAESSKNRLLGHGGDAHRPMTKEVLHACSQSIPIPIGERSSDGR